MSVRAGAIAVALGLALAALAPVPESVALPTASTPSVEGPQCPVQEIKKVWYGEKKSSKKCPHLRSQLENPYYPQFEGPYSTAFRHTYGQNVVFIQLRLYDRGYKRIVVDGYYGKLTRKVVKTYQRRHGLVVDGRVGVQTWKALFGRGYRCHVCE